MGTTGRLTALKVTRLVGKPGMHADGGGLYLQVTNGGASWIYRYMLNGRACEMGLGPLPFSDCKKPGRRRSTAGGYATMGSIQSRRGAAPG